MATGLNSYVKKSDRDYFATINTCSYCGCKNASHIDHIIPPKNGGNSHISNLTKSCAVCNGIKTDHTLEDFMRNAINRRDWAAAQSIRVLLIFKKLKRRNEPYTAHGLELLKKHRQHHSKMCAIIGSLLTEKFRTNG